MIRFSPRPNRAHLIKWREWSDETFQEAERLNKPLVVFITAFWCGVCQRMDERALSRDEVIALLNAFFIPVRLEESQRPDIDIRYNQNGWPTIAFLTPAGHHLLSTNYSEPEPFITLLTRVVDYHQRSDAASLEAELAPPDQNGPETPAPLGWSIVEEMAGIVEGLADQVHGGFGVEAKFLHTEANEFLLYLYEITGNRAYLDQALLTVDKLRASRTFDAKAGGFFRYSSRRDWQEPHEEKLLADQAGLLENYLHAYLLTENESYRQTAAGLVEYLDNTLSDGSAPFFWGCEDYVRSLAPRGASGPPPLLSLIDRYVYCDANARTASAYVAAWVVLGREDCGRRALELLGWLWENQRSAGGGMYHTWIDGQAAVARLLVDNVAMGLALLDAHAATGDKACLARATELGDYVLGHHRCPAGGFYDITETGPANLRVRLTLLTQNASASAFFLRLADFDPDPRYREAALWALAKFPNSHRDHGAFAAGFGRAVAQLLSPTVTVKARGKAGDANMLRLLRAAATQIRQSRLALRYDLSASKDAAASLEIEANARTFGPISDPAVLTAELLAAGA